MPQQWLCVVCSRSFSSRSSRNRHQNTVHNFRTIFCPHCMTILKSQIELTLHLLRLHREEKGTQTTPLNTPNPGPAQNTAIPPPPHCHIRGSLHPPGAIPGTRGSGRNFLLKVRKTSFPKKTATKTKPRNIGSTVILRPKLVACNNANMRDFSHTCFTCTGKTTPPVRNATVQN